MNNRIIEIDKFNFGEQLLSNIFNIEDIVSSTIVGSFKDKKIFNLKSDIDLVVVCNKLSKKTFEKIIQSVKKTHSKNKSFNIYKLKINKSFGPLKFKLVNTVVIHLMIYDINSHIKHVINSPFTCHDWERSKWFKGLKLSKIFQVGTLQINDFINSRRGIQDYISDLKKNVISYREYNFKNKKIYVNLKKKKINLEDSYEFSYHIINNLLINFNKFEKNRNILLTDVNFKKLFLKITLNDKDLLNKFIFIKKNKKNKKSVKIEDLYSNIIITQKFINYFKRYINTFVNDFNKVTFLRHAKTKFKKNIFLGQKINPNINKTKIKFKKNFDICFTSPMRRSISTANLLIKKSKIVIDSNINEIDYGSLEGKDYFFLRKNYPKIIFNWKHKKDTKFPNGENLLDVSKRLKLFTQKLLRYNNKYSNILVVTHNVCLRCLIGKNFKVPTYLWYKIKISYLDSFNFFIYNNQLRSLIDRKMLYSTIL